MLVGRSNGQVLSERKAVILLGVSEAGVIRSPCSSSSCFCSTTWADGVLGSGSPSAAQGATGGIIGLFFTFPLERGRRAGPLVLAGGLLLKEMPRQQIWRHECE